MTDLARRLVTEQVRRFARIFAEVACRLGCDWHTVKDTVVAYGQALVDNDPDHPTRGYSCGTTEPCSISSPLRSTVTGTCRP